MFCRHLILPPAGKHHRLLQLNPVLASAQPRMRLGANRFFAWINEGDATAVRRLELPTLRVVGDWRSEKTELYTCIVSLFS